MACLATVLLVEDNPDHAMLAMKAFKKGKLTPKIDWVKDGQEALDFLGRDPSVAPRPGLILLDIHLPKVDGHEVLRRIKTDPELSAIPVVMLTTSDRAADVAASYDLGANSHVTKPVSAELFIEQVQALGLYWLMASTLPAAQPVG